MLGSYELSVSPNTVRTHIRSLCAKLGTHHRAEAVSRARDLGLLAPSSRRDRGPSVHIAQAVCGMGGRPRPAV